MTNDKNYDALIKRLIAIRKQFDVMDMTNDPKAFIKNAVCGWGAFCGAIDGFLNKKK